MKQHQRKARNTKFESVHTLFAICTRVTTLHCVIETALVFSQSEARNFFMFIIIQENLNQKARKRLRSHSFENVRLFLFKVFCFRCY